MTKGDIETYFEDGVWKNRPQGNTNASNIAETKAEAKKKGRKMAKSRKVEHVIKKKDGTVKKKKSYAGPPDAKG